MFGKRKNEELTQSYLDQSTAGQASVPQPAAHTRDSSRSVGDSGREVETMAVIAESIHRALGITLSREQVAIGLAMREQIHRIRPRRAAKSIRILNRYLPTRRDRSLAAALPAIYVGTFLGLDVCVMVSQDSYAREDAELYRAILKELGAPTEVMVNDENRRPETPTGGRHARITVATPEVLLRSPGRRQSVIIARLSPEATKRVGRGITGSATLPDL